jgi:hypothetical protein
MIPVSVFPTAGLITPFRTVAGQALTRPTVTSQALAELSASVGRGVPALIKEPKK